MRRVLGLGAEIQGDDLAAITRCNESAGSISAMNRSIIGCSYEPGDGSLTLQMGKPLFCRIPALASPDCPSQHVTVALRPDSSSVRISSGPSPRAS